MHLGRDAATAGESRRLALCHVQHQVNIVAVQLCRLGDDVDIVKQAHAEDHVNVLLGLAGTEDLQQSDQVRPTPLLEALPAILQVDHKAGQETLEMLFWALAPFRKPSLLLQEPQSGTRQVAAGRGPYIGHMKVLQAPPLQCDVCMTQSALSHFSKSCNALTQTDTPFSGPEQPPHPSVHTTALPGLAHTGNWRANCTHLPYLVAQPTHSNRCQVPPFCCTLTWVAAWWVRPQPVTDPPALADCPAGA